MNIPIKLAASITGNDYNLFVAPYLDQIEAVRKVLMTPYPLPAQKGKYGYDSASGLIRGANIEPSPAIGVSGGNNDAIVYYDSNMEGSASLDFFNGVAGVSTQIFQTAYNTLTSATWYGVGACSKPFKAYRYPSDFPLLDRRDPSLGTFSPFYSIFIKSGAQIATTGSSCGTQGQTWYLFKDAGITPYTNPLLVTELPSNTPVGINSDLEMLNFLIDLLYIQNSSSWRTAFMNAMNQYPFSAPRQALHFIECCRNTKAWADTTFPTVQGLTVLQMIQATITKIWTPSANGGAMGTDGGLYQAWGGGGSSNTPEPNFQAMRAFDPRGPSWFGN